MKGERILEVVPKYEVPEMEFLKEAGANGHWSLGPRYPWLICLPEHRFYDGFSKPYSLRVFGRPEANFPLPLCHSYLEEVDFSNVTRMPVKYPYSEYRYPEEVRGLWAFLAFIAEYESRFNYRENEMYVYLSACKRVVKAGEVYKPSGWHVDGLDVEALGTQTDLDSCTVEHSFVVCSSPVTEYCVQPFELTHGDVFQQMRDQAKDENVYRVIPWYVYLVDSYMVHRSPIVAMDTYRTFIKVVYSFSELPSAPHTENLAWKTT